MAATIRDAQVDDEQACSLICLKTGDHGEDGEAFFREDPDALSRIYTTPYLRFAIELGLILEDELGVCGYALGALDSRSFYERYENECRPELCRQFPAPSGDSASWTRIESVYDCYHNPDYFCPNPYENYPSHLHIDLLGRARGQGHGRRMIEKMLRRLRDRGSPGVHLGMSAINEPAFGFYVTLGFEELTRRDDTIYMGMRLE